MAAKRKSNRTVGIAPAADYDWQTEEDLRTLQRACEIRKDPKRLAKAKALAQTKLAELKKVTGETAETY